MMAVDMGSLDENTLANLKAWQSKPFDKATRAQAVEIGSILA